MEVRGNRAFENAYEEVSMFDSIDETTSLVGKTGKIIQSRKRNFDELSNDDNKSKKVHFVTLLETGDNFGSEDDNQDC